MAGELLVRDTIDSTAAKALHYERFSAPPVRDGTAERDDSMLICVSRSQTTQLMLDL